MLPESVIPLLRVLASVTAFVVGAVPCAAAAQSAETGRANDSPALAAEEASSCDDEETDCGPEETCVDGACVAQLAPGASSPSGTDPEPAQPASPDTAFIRFIGSLGVGPMAFSFQGESIMLAGNVGVGIEFPIDQRFSLPIRLDAQYVLNGRGTLYSYQPSAGVRLTMTETWLSFMAGLCKWPLQHRWYEYNRNRPAGESGTQAAFRFGWSVFELEAAVDLFDDGTIKFIALGVAL